LHLGKEEKKKSSLQEEKKKSSLHKVICISGETCCIREGVIYHVT